MFSLKMGVVNEMEVGSGWWASSFLALSVIVRTFVYVLIWSTLHKVP